MRYNGIPELHRHVWPIIQAYNNILVISSQRLPRTSDSEHLTPRLTPSSRPLTTPHDPSPLFTLPYLLAQYDAHPHTIANNLLPTCFRITYIIPTTDNHLISFHLPSVTISLIALPSSSSLAQLLLIFYNSFQSFPSTITSLIDLFPIISFCPYIYPSNRNISDDSSCTPSRNHSRSCYTLRNISFLIPIMNGILEGDIDLNGDGVICTLEGH